MKKLLALVLALVMTLSLCTISNAAFTDAKDVNADYEEAVAVLNGMGVFKGYEDGSFKPTGAITRAEVAAIVYRLYTGDVKDKQADLYAGYGKFDDMAGAQWAAGYVGFCANAGFVKGYGNGKFGPADPVTGYQALAMILRAVGYGKNGEFEGADWELHVAQLAQQLKVLKNVKNVSLKTAATRELVAELLFQVAAKVNTVTYTPAFGYVSDKFATTDKDLDTETLGWKNFKLTKDETDNDDDWGRPTYVWYGEYSNKNATPAIAGDYNSASGSKDVLYATIAAKPVATYTEAVSYCDICKDLGESKNAQFGKIFENGQNKGFDTFSATSSTKYGAQGELVEIYDMTDYHEDDNHDQNWYRIVMIDTYLAKVESVSELKYDNNNHLRADAKIVLDVLHSQDMPGGHNVTLTDDEANFDYAKGDYVLVNVNKAKTTNSVILGLADSVDAKQTKIHVNSAKHTIDGTEYNDACKFYNDANMTKTSLYTWFFDQYGNVIGCKEVKEPKNYGVVTYIEKFEGTREGSYVLADITYMDQTTVTDVRVASVKNSSGQNINVSTDPKANEKTISYFHLYEITVNDDDELELRDQTEVLSAVKTKMTTLVDYTGVKLNNDTQFVVLTGDGSKKTPYELSFVKGIDEVGTYDEGDVHYVLNDDNYAEYVLITASAEKNVAYQYLYIDGTAYTEELDNNLVKNYIFEGAVTLDEGKNAKEAVLLTIPAADEDLLTALIKSEGMPVLVKTENGKVKDVTNVANDGCPVQLPKDNDFEMVYCGGAINASFVTDYYKNSTLEIKGFLSAKHPYPYNLNGVKAVLVDGKVGELADLEDEALQDAGIKAIYVVRDTAKTYLAEYVVLSSTNATSTCEVHPEPRTVTVTGTMVNHGNAVTIDKAAKVTLSDASHIEKAQTVTIEAKDGWKITKVNDVEWDGDESVARVAVPAGETDVTITYEVETIAYTLAVTNTNNAYTLNKTGDALTYYVTSSELVVTATANVAGVAETNAASDKVNVETVDTNGKNVIMTKVAGGTVTTDAEITNARAAATVTPYNGKIYDSSSVTDTTAGGPAGTAIPGVKYETSSNPDDANKYIVEQEAWYVSAGKTAATIKITVAAGTHANSSVTLTWTAKN